MATDTTTSAYLTGERHMLLVGRVVNHTLHRVLSVLTARSPWSADTRAGERTSAQDEISELVADLHLLSLA